MQLEQNTKEVDCLEILEAYSAKGIFSGLKSEASGSDLRFRFRWHMKRMYELRISRDFSKCQLLGILPSVPKQSALDKNFREFTHQYFRDHQKRQQTGDPNLLKAIVRNRNGSVSVQVFCAARNVDVMIPELINFLHQTYAYFLRIGGYDEYLVEAFGVDLDSYM